MITESCSSIFGPKTAAFIQKVISGGFIGLKIKRTELLSENARGDNTKFVVSIQLKSAQ